MINEDSQSESLGRWLDADNTEGAPPDDLDFDVLEAVYALRPDLAPAPKTSIEEILAHLEQADATARLVDGGDAAGVDADVREGLFALRPDLAPAPTTSIEEILSHVEQADAARRVIDGEPVAVDADVRDAIYALRPDRAPAPTTSIEAILAKVTSGPLAAPTAEVISFPTRPVASAKIVPANKPARSWTRVLAGSGAIGLFAVAAAAALLVLPNLSMLKGPSMPDGAGPMPTMSAPSTPTSRPAPVTPIAEQVAVDGSATDATKAREAQEMAPVAKAPARAFEPMPIAEVAAATPPVDARPAPPAAVTTYDDAVVDGFENEEAKKDQAEEYWSQPADAPAGGLFGGEVATGAGASGTSATADVAVDNSRQEKPRVTRGAASNMAVPPAPVVAAAPSAPPPPAKTEAKSTAAKESGSLEAQARSLAAAGRYADAARTLLPAIVLPRETGQTFAAMAAEWFLDANDVPAARDAVTRGLALGTPVRSELSRADAAVTRAEQPAAAFPVTMDQ